MGKALSKKLLKLIDTTVSVIATIICRMMANSGRKIPKAFILDVDGVLTTGQFGYTVEGKALKIFGPDDTDALSILRSRLHIGFVSADHNGFAISSKRIIDHMKYPLDLVPVTGRSAWIGSRYNSDEVIYMGDGIFDHYVLRSVGYGIAPANAHPFAKQAAHYVTQRSGGHGAVAEAVLHILEIFFEPYNPLGAHEPSVGKVP